MGVREAARFAVDVLVIVVLMLVYVVGLTVETLVSYLREAVRSLRAVGERGEPSDKTEPSHERTNTGGR